MSMRKTEEVRKRVDTPRRVRVGPTQTDAAPGGEEMPRGSMDAPAGELRFTSGDEMPRGAMDDGGGEAGSFFAGADEMPRGGMEGGAGTMELAATPGGEMPAGRMDGRAEAVAAAAAGTAGMPLGEMNRGDPAGGGTPGAGEMPAASPGAVTGPLDVEIGGEWRLTLTASFARPRQG